jgi:hypothetical protein
MGDDSKTTIRLLGDVEVAATTIEAIKKFHFMDRWTEKALLGEIDLDLPPSSTTVPAKVGCPPFYRFGDPMVVKLFLCWWADAPDKDKATRKKLEIKLAEIEAAEREKYEPMPAGRIADESTAGDWLIANLKGIWDITNPGR